jgi:two-component system KDP operon response regulator KdpE
MNAFRILGAGSNADQRGDLRAAMEFEGYEVGEAATAGHAVQTACAGHYHALIMNSIIDGIGAHGLCHTIRSQSKLGIIVSGRNLGTTAIDVLNAGADDFVLAPFVPAEMLARVRALLRRVSRFDEPRQIVLQDREVDLNSYAIKGPGGQLAHLTPKESLVLQYLVAHANESRTTQALARNIWQRDGKGELEYVRIVIRQLRRKLEPDPANPRYILTERAEGYRFQMPSIPPKCYRFERRAEEVSKWAQPA